jgi:hypothetical protein
MAKATMKTRIEIIQRNKKTYAKASKKTKSQIIEHLCVSTGLSRDRVKRLLNVSTKKLPKKQKPGRKPKYDAVFAKTLEKVWFFMDFACGKRLVAGMNDMVEALITFGELTVDPEIITKLQTISAATADRLLAKTKKGMVLKGKSTTKPGSLLKRNIPIRLGNEWDDALPGFVEIDLVAHCGATTAGDYVNTLSVTDIYSGWTETVAVRNKAQVHVFAGLKDIQTRQPFPYRGIDSDNGSEFINDQLYRWCKENGICFTRSRPYKKNDNCHIEQKNWHVVRRNIGYNRYEGQEATNALNAYYALLRLYTNFFLPQTKLIGKIRMDARIRKRYDIPKTPYRRLLESDVITADLKQVLYETFFSLNPVALKRDMVKALDTLLMFKM